MRYSLFFVVFVKSFCQSPTHAACPAQVVLPAVRGAAPQRGRDCAVRPQLVQPRGRRKGDDSLLLNKQASNKVDR